MTHARTILPPDEPARSPERGRILGRIASTLGVPVSTFVAADAREPRPPSPAETEALLAAFARIADPATRRRCLDLVRALSGA